MSTMQIMPKILIPGHEQHSRPFRGSKTSVFYKVRSALHPWSPLVRGLKNCFSIKNTFETISRGLQGWRALLTLRNTEFFDPKKGLEGYLCPEIKILGMIYIVDTPFDTSNQRCLTFSNFQGAFPCTSQTTACMHLTLCIRFSGLFLSSKVDIGMYLCSLF